MSSIPPSESPEGAEPAPVVNDAWYLQSGRRRFGPLSEDELRGYFRAGMVKAGDAISIPGQVGTASATVVAELLHEAAPPPATTTGEPISRQALPPPVFASTTESSHIVGWLGTAGALLAMGVLGYLGFSGRLTPSRAPAPSEAAQSAQPVVGNSEPSTTSPALDNPIETAAPGNAATPGAPTDVAATASASRPAAAPIIAETVKVVPDVTAQSVNDAWYLEAYRLAEQADWNGLLTHSLRWTAAEPHRDLAWWFLGSAYANLKNNPEAIVALQHVLSITPRHPQARLALAHLYLQSRRFRESADMLNELLKEQPNEVTLWINLGIATAQLGEYDESEAALQKAVQLEPRNRLAWYHLGRTYDHFGYLDKAKEAYAKVDALR
jgi:predicted Zn-dependent protease